MPAGRRRSLLIIESPAKARTIKGYLGEGFEIVASMGHVRDLPRQRLGISSDGYRPAYTILPEKRATIEALRRAASGHDVIYLAADPDREGEAICWHLSELLGSSGANFRRLSFNEITAEAVQRALRSPSSIDMDLVDAQQARRVMDRLVGYKVSPYLWKTVGPGLSAGRVQTVALRLVTEREERISSFVPVEYWPVRAVFSRSGARFEAVLARIDGRKVDGERNAPSDGERARSLVAGMREMDWRVASAVTRTVRLKPMPPFITSTLQQTASSAAGMSPSRTMSLAQELYEGMEVDGVHTGLITYMRTDSVRIAPEAAAAARKWIATVHGERMLPDAPRRFRSSARSQDAHEAIRPTDVSRTPESLSGVIPDPHLKLYSLIWRRFAASQAADAEIARTTLTVEGGGLEFRSEGETIRSRGFTELDPGQVAVSAPLPGGIDEGPAVLVEAGTEQCFTKPPQRFTEAMLVAEMKKLGIGRPSTYVSIIETIRKRGYVRLAERRLHPTELGSAVASLLVRLFPAIFDTGFTAAMESVLDRVAAGETRFAEAVGELDAPLEESLGQAMVELDSVRRELSRPTGEKCPQCGSQLVLKPGRWGEWYSCSAYPSCRFRKAAAAGEDSGRKCPLCGSPLVVRTGRFGRFLACSTAPACRHTEPVPTGVGCPEEGCGGELVEKRTGRGRVFYSCNRYPACRFATWGRPVPERCERCGFPFMEETKRGRVCPRCRKPGPR